MNNSLKKTLTGWSQEDLSNLCAILKIDQTNTVEQILEHIKWLFHSKTRAIAKSSTKNILGKLSSKAFSSEHKLASSEEVYEIPAYGDLVIGACKYLKAWEKDTSTEELEVFLVQAVIATALTHMSPSDRKEVFKKQIDVSQMSEQARIPNTEITGPVTTLFPNGCGTTLWLWCLCTIYNGTRFSYSSNWSDVAICGLHWAN